MLISKVCTLQKILPIPECQFLTHDRKYITDTQNRFYSLNFHLDGGVKKLLSIQGLEFLAILYVIQKSFILGVVDLRYLSRLFPY